MVEISRITLMPIGSILILSIAFLSSDLSAQSTERRQLADEYYRRGLYDLAKIEYDRILFYQQKENSLSVRNSSAMASLRMKQPAIAIHTLLSASSINSYNQSLSNLRSIRSSTSKPGQKESEKPEDIFFTLYLLQYSYLQVSQIQNSVEVYRNIQSMDSLSDKHKDLSELLAGTIYLEQGNYNRADEHYSRLQKWTDSETVRDISGAVRSDLMEYRQLDRKSLWLSGLLSAILPGAGQVYSSHTIDGITAFLFNLVFLGSAAAAYSLESRANSGHILSGALGTVGLVFYASNITGAIASAKRYNIYQERKFQQGIRERFFNDDFIEKTGQLGFQFTFQ